MQTVREQNRMEVVENYCWSRNNPDAAPSHLMGILPKLFWSSWHESENKCFTKAPEGHKPVVVRVKDEYHAYSIPQEIPMVTIKCALRWYFKGTGCHGKNGNYVVSFQ